MHDKFQIRPLPKTDTPRVTKSVTPVTPQAIEQTQTPTNPVWQALALHLPSLVSMNDTRTFKPIEQMTEAEIKESARALDLALQELGKASESMDKQSSVRLNDAKS